VFRPRRPEDFDALYAGTPPWDIGRPQPAFLALAEAGAVRGRVLDVGCGTGEHALMAAGSGLFHVLDDDRAAYDPRGGDRRRDGVASRWSAAPKRTSRQFRVEGRACVSPCS
jgi:SAM-dependent methyltransferase